MEENDLKNLEMVFQIARANSVHDEKQLIELIELRKRIFDLIESKNNIENKAS
jgi:hypothetical protein